jgi:hypothetical protein
MKMEFGVALGSNLKVEDIVLQQLRRDSGLRVTCIEAAVYTITDQKGTMREIGSQILPHFDE